MDLSAIELYRPASINDERSGSPLFSDCVAAGFPSPAEDYIEKTVDLHKLLIKNEPATFILKVAGDSMTGARIQNNDIIILDRSIMPMSGHIVVAAVEGQLTLKKLIIEQKRAFLRAGNPKYPDIDITHTDSVIQGVATYGIYNLLKGKR